MSDARYISSRPSANPLARTQEGNRALVSPGQQKGISRGQNVFANPAGKSPVLTAAQSKFGTTQAQGTNLSYLLRRMVRPGRTTNQEAVAKLLTSYGEKLPNMPNEAAMQHLVETFQSFSREIEKRDEEKTEADGGGVGAEAEGTAESGQKGKSKIFAILQEFDPDVTHQFAALDMAREYFARSKAASKQFEELLAEAAEEFEKDPDLARDVRAGFAAAKVAHAASQTLETDPASVRETYRNLLRNQKNMGQLFDALSKFDILKKFEEVIDTFREAAGADLASTGPSTDPDFLNGLLLELGKLKRLQTVFEMNKLLLSDTERQMPPGAHTSLDPVRATSHVLNYASKSTVNLADARQLLVDFERMDPRVQLVFVNGVRNLYGQIPNEVWSSDAIRLQQITTLTLLQSYLVAAEEEFYEKHRVRKHLDGKKEKETRKGPVPRTLLGVTHKQDQFPEEDILS